LFRAETCTIRVTVVYVLRDEVSVGSDKKINVFLIPQW